MNWPPRIGILDIYSSGTWQAWPQVFNAMRELRDPLDIFNLTEDIVMEAWGEMIEMEKRK